MDTTTAELLTQSLRRALTGDSPVEKALDEVGWREALLAEGASVSALLFAEQGAANATSGAIDDVLVAAAGRSPDADVGFVLPRFGRHRAPGQACADDLAVLGVGSARLLTAERAVVVAADAGGHRAGLVLTRHLRLRPVEGVDPRHHLVTVQADRIRPADWADPAAVDWPGAVAAGQLALAYELIGAGRSMLRLAREHALSRIQFGRPISSFQAVRHRLADSLVAIEAAQAAADLALESAGCADGAGGAPALPLLAGIAKALAGRGARTVARDCQQVLAGVGFTTEHSFHRYFRRVLTLDGLLGDASTLTRELGEELLRTRLMPAAPPL